MLCAISLDNFMCAVGLDTTYGICLIVFALWYMESIKKYSSFIHCAYFNIFELCYYCVFLTGFCHLLCLWNHIKLQINSLYLSCLLTGLQIVLELVCIESSLYHLHMCGLLHIFFTKLSLLYVSLYWLLRPLTTE